MPAVIETHPKKQEIIDALLAGESLRKIAVKAGVSHSAVQNYKNNVLLPSLNRAAKIAKMEQLTQVSQDQQLDSVHVAALTKVVASVSEKNSGSGLAAQWFEKQEKLWQNASDLYDKSLAAQRVYTDKDGKEVFAGQDFSAPTGVLNQLHRNQELSGKAAGVLRESDSGMRVENMLVVMPRAAEPVGQVSAASEPAIDVTPER